MQHGDSAIERRSAGTPSWVASALDTFRADALAVGVRDAQADATIGWIETLVDDTAHDPAHDTTDDALCEAWTTRDELRSTVWAVASHTHRSASDALAIIAEFAGSAGHTSLAGLAACDLRDTAAVLRGRSPAEADLIDHWRRRSGTRCATTLDAIISKPAQITNCWLGGDSIERDELVSAIVSAGIGSTPLVVELDDCYRRFALAVLFLADENSTSSEAWCLDLSSGTAGWLSRFGGWIPTS